MEDGLRDLTAGRVLGEVEEGRWRQGGGGREAEGGRGYLWTLPWPCGVWPALASRVLRPEVAVGWVCASHTQR